MKKPIIILGTGRSGTTVFAELLSSAQETVYPSQITSKLPDNLFFSRLYLRISKMRFIGIFARNLIRISESYPFWDTAFLGFSNPSRNLYDYDVNPKIKKSIINKTNKLAINKKSRLLIKITGWPRISFLKEIFPDAVFIHVVRDGRAVANSLMNVDFWQGWRGPGEWRLGELSQDEKLLYEKENKTSTALAGIYWNKLIDATENDIKQYRPNMLLVKYEDLCECPEETMKTVFKHCDLEWTNKSNKIISSRSIESTNDKWRRDLSESQKKTIYEVTKRNNRRYGYITVGDEQ